MKNYYEILEVNKNASQEVIDKAYKVLVKKYHPDLQQTPAEKNKCEEMIKEINKAYETISDSSLRSEYDKQLEAEYNQQKQYEKEQILKQYNNNAQNNQSTQNTGTVYYKAKPIQQQQQQEQSNGSSKEHGFINVDATIEKIQQQVSDAIDRAYNDAYITDLKNRGYKIKYKKSFREHLNSVIALLITILIIILLFQIPIVRSWFYQFYEDNELIKYIVDAFSNAIKK